MDESKLTDEAIVMELCRHKQFLLEEQERTGNTPNTQLVYVTGEGVFEILDLIYRLQSDIERLTKWKDKLQNTKDELEQQLIDTGFKEYCEENKRLTEQNTELQKQVDELKSENTELYKEHTALIAGSILDRQKQKAEIERLTKELSNIPDPFPCKVGSGCEAAGQSCYDCPNNRYRQQVAREILQRGKYCMPSGLRDWIKEHYDVEVE